MHVPLICTYFNNKAMQVYIYQSWLYLEKETVFGKERFDAMKFYFREFRTPQIKEAPKTQRELILEALEKTKCELDTAYRGFDYVTEPDLIDCYIYDINAILKRYKYLLELAAKFNPEPEPFSYPSDSEAPVTAYV